MEVIDYNKTPTFSFEVIVARYRDACQQHGVKNPIQFQPRERSAEGKKWVYPIWHDVEQGITKNDPACIDLGIWCLEVEEPIPFGCCIRNSIANKLYRSQLSDHQKKWLKKVITTRLLSRHPGAHYRRLGRLFFRTNPQGSDFAPFKHSAEDDVFISRRKDYITMKQDANKSSQTIPAMHPLFHHDLNEINPQPTRTLT